MLHGTCILKHKNNYYFDSYNDYIKVSKDDIKNYNFAKIFLEHGKLTYKNTLESVFYIITLET